MNIHTETIPQSTKEVLSKIKHLSALKKFYLSAGTALSLQLGHRESEDLDFFNGEQFDPQVVQQQLLEVGSLDNTEISLGTLNTFLQGVKLQFLYYPYRLLEEPEIWDGIFISSVIDIACTKLITISMRGSKKDFVDLYVILQTITLQELFKKLDEKYQDINYNHTHILKSLVYFEDADRQPMPRMHIALNWDEVKRVIVEKVREFKF